MGVFYDLASYAGRGLEEGFARQRQEDADVRGFQRLTPLQVERLRQQKEMELPYTIGAEQRAEQKTIGAEKRRTALEREKDAAALTATAPYLAESLATETPGQPGAIQPSGPMAGLRDPFSVPTPPTRTPYAVPPGTPWEATKALIGVGQAREKANRPVQPRDRAHQPYDDAYRRVLAGGGSPVEAEAAGAQAAAAASGAKVGAGIAATQAAPPTVNPKQLDDINQGDALLKQLDKLEADFDANQHLIGGIGTGAGTYRRKARQAFPSLFGRLNVTEQDWIAKAEQFRGGEILDFFGKVVPKGEQNIAARMIPDVDVMQPEQFRAALKATRARIIMGMEGLRTQLRTPVGQAGRPGTPEGDVVDLGGGFKLRRR